MLLVVTVFMHHFTSHFFFSFLIVLFGFVFAEIQFKQKKKKERKTNSQNWNKIDERGKSRRNPIQTESMCFYFGLNLFVMG